MENLLCNEVWLMSPKRHRLGESYITANTSSNTWFYTTKKDCEEAFRMRVKKEMMSCMHESGYVDRLNSNGSINIIARSKAFHWLIQSRSRLNLCFGTVSNAANYFDRFVSANQFNGWKCWVIELVSVACLSIASKFGETSPPPLHDIQMQGMDHTFESGLIERMELTVLKALDWRLICTTPFSYVELMTWNIIDLLAKPLLVDQLMDRLNDLLLGTLLDSKFLAFRPSVIAVSALKCVLEELFPSTPHAHYLSYLSTLIPIDQKENMKQCYKMLEERMYNSEASMYNYPSSPVTVLTMERVYICVSQVDLSLFTVPCLNIKANKKRKIIEQDRII